MNRLIVPIMACTIVLMAGHPLAAGAPAQAEQVVLQLQWKHQFQFAGYYAAKYKGFYQQAGLDVQILEAPTEGVPAHEVLQGKADFGIASSDLVLLRNQGHPVVALASIFQHSPLIFLALKTAGIDSVHDLVGKRVIIEPHATELLAYLKYEAIPISELTILPHAFDPSALLQEQVDATSAYSTDEPFLLQEAGKEYVIFTPRAGGIDFYGDVLFTTENQIKKHPQRVRAFIDASLKGWEYALDHSEEIIELIFKQYSQRHSREHLAFEAEKTRQLILSDVVEIGYMNPGRWQHITATYADMGMSLPKNSLNGFLYDRNPKANLTWIYLSLLGAISAVGLISGVAIRFYQLNTAIRREILEKEMVTANLRILEKRYRILVENAPFPILISRLSDGLLLYVNPSAAQKLEMTQEHAIGKSSQDYYVNPGSRENLVTAIEQQGYIRNNEILLKSSTGREFWANLSATLISFEGEPAIFVAVVDVTEQKELERRLEVMAMTDDLTGLNNRRYFTRKGTEEFRRARRYTSALSVIMLDVDRFKSINDTYGHAAGDYVLKELAILIRQNLRDVDIPGRLGGEEFAILLPNTNHQSTLILAERLRQNIATHLFEINDQSIPSTASMGVASLNEDSVNLEELLNQADAALYRAKLQGRNRVGSSLEDKTNIS